MAHAGRVLTRLLIAIGQILISLLLIQLTGGRVQTCFHVFGSLAFLAFYRDWRVLVTATSVLAVDQILRVPRPSLFTAGASIPAGRA